MEDIEDVSGGASPGLRLPLMAVGMKPKKPKKPKARKLESRLSSTLQIPGTQTISMNAFGCSNYQKSLAKMDKEMSTLVTLLSSSIFLLMMMWYYRHLYTRGKIVRVHDSALTGHQFVREIINGHPRISYDLLRMNTDVFLGLCELLKTRDLLRPTKIVTVEEQVAIFLYTLGHNERNRAMQNRFQHSGQTISKYFNTVLNAVLRIALDVIKPPSNDIPSQIATNPIYYPFFKDCIGAVDGTLIPAWIRVGDQLRYRSRKGFLAQNVMAVVSFDMLFQFVSAGYEGSAVDSKVLSDALHNRGANGLKVPPSKYYLVDAGYPNMQGFLAPYRGVRYHLKEYGPLTLAPRSPEEIFNLRHSKLRNVVERTFGVLKMRFPILSVPPRNFPFKTQVKIVMACCVLHNFIKISSSIDNLLEEHQGEAVTYDADESGEDEQIGNAHEIYNRETQASFRLRDEIAQQMWDAR